MIVPHPTPTARAIWHAWLLAAGFGPKNLPEFGSTLQIARSITRVNFWKARCLRMLNYRISSKKFRANSLRADVNRKRISALFGDRGKISSLDFHRADVKTPNDAKY